MLCLCPYVKPNSPWCHDPLPISPHWARSHILILLWLEIDVLVKLRHWGYMGRRVKLLLLKSVRHDWRLEFIRIVHHLRRDPVLLRHWGTRILLLLLKLRLLKLLLRWLVLWLIDLHLLHVPLHEVLLRLLHLLKLRSLLHLWLRHPVLLELLLLRRIVLLHGRRCRLVQISFSVRSSCACLSKGVLEIIEFFSFSSFFFFLFELLFHLFSFCFVLQFAKVCLFISLISSWLFKRKRRPLSWREPWRNAYRHLLRMNHLLSNRHSLLIGVHLLKPWRLRLKLWLRPRRRLILIFLHIHEILLRNLHRNLLLHLLCLLKSILLWIWNMARKLSPDYWLWHQLLCCRRRSTERNLHIRVLLHVFYLRSYHWCWWFWP